MTTLTDRLAYPNVRRVFLVEVTAGERYRHWTKTGGLTYTYEATTSRWISSLRENGAALTSRASTALVDANAGSYYWDQAGGKVYVHCTGGASPYTKTVQGMAKFFFSTKGRVYNSVYYDPRITSLPNTSLRVEEEFGDPGQLGGGFISLANNDGYFDLLTGLQWDAGSLSILMGADSPLLSPVADLSLSSGFITDPASDGFITDSSDSGFLSGSSPPAYTRTPAEYADFDVVATWRVTKWEKKDDKFGLTLEEPKGQLKKKVPTAMYDRATYPNLEDNAEDKPIPVAYGTIYDVRPVCIDVTARQFKVAGHAIHEFLGCRVKTTGTGDSEGTWTAVNFSTSDIATATFTLSGSDWDGKADVAADFRGKRTGSVLMDNAADVVEDILTVVVGEPASLIDSTTFTESYDRLCVGQDSDGADVTSRGISLYLNETRDAYKVLSDINAAVGSYLFSDYEGVYRYVVFEPTPGNDAALFEESDIWSFTEITDAQEIATKVVAKYQYRHEQDYSQVITHERTGNQYLQGASSAVLKEWQMPFSERKAAEYVAQRTTRMNGERRRIYKAEVSHRGWTLLPADKIRVVYARHSFNALLEVLEVTRDLNRQTVVLILGDLHGMRDEYGFWTADSPTFPASLGGASCGAWSSAWTDAQKAWARQNVGYWTDENGFADSTDPDSCMAGAWF